MLISPEKSFTPFTVADVVDGYQRRRIECDAEQSPRRRKILRNYILHAMLEISGRYEEIFSRGLMADHPEYEYFQEGVSFHGIDAVKGMYRGLTDNTSTAILSDPRKRRIAIADWGFAVEQVNHYYLNSELALQRGIPVRSGCSYVLHRPVSMLWNYDDKQRLIGERLYHAAHSTYSEIDEEQFILPEMLRNALAPLISVAQADLEKEG